MRTWIIITAVLVIATAITVWCIKPSPAPVEVEKIVTVHDTIKITDTKYKVITTKGKIVYQDKVITWEDTSKIASLETLLAALSGQTTTETQYVDREKLVNKPRTWGVGICAGYSKPKVVDIGPSIEFRNLEILPRATWSKAVLNPDGWAIGLRYRLRF